MKMATGELDKALAWHQWLSDRIPNLQNSGKCCTKN